MSEIPNSLVKLGFWVNWSYGAILGATITTYTGVGNVVVALLAILVSLAALHLWNLLIFSYYQIRVANPRSDDLFKQQQVLLRTLPGPHALIIDFLRLGWVWRSKARNALVRCAVPCAFATLILLLSVTAGIFSSLVVTTNDLQVLVDSPGCGFPRTRNGPADEVAATSQSTNLVSEYSQMCDTSNSITPSICNVFVQPRIPFSIEAAKCPFSSSMCIGTGNLAVSFDTHLLDTNIMFGINAARKDRVKMRFKTTCAPIRVSDMYSISGTSYAPGEEHLQGQKSWYFHYGGNYTAKHSTYSANVTMNYSLWSSYQYAGEHVQRGSTFIPELRRSDADTTLVFVYPNNVHYIMPVQDPVFMTKTKGNFEYYNEEWFRPKYPAGVVGCTEQVQFCVGGNANSKQDCTSLRGLPRYPLELFPNATEIQKATMNLYLKAKASISDIKLRIPEVLKASKSVSGEGFQYTELPENQWALESQGWFEYFLVELQDVVTQYAQGIIYNDHLGRSDNIKPSTPGEEWLCRSVKMKKTGGFANINVFGLSITIAVSILLPVLDMAILKGFIYLKKVRRIMTRQVDAWIHDGVFQLQRRASEAHGFKTWTRLDKEIPLTASNVQLDSPSCNSASSQSDDTTESHSVLSKVDNEDTGLQT